MNKGRKDVGDIFFQQGVAEWRDISVRSRIDQFPMQTDDARSGINDGSSGKHWCVYFCPGETISRAGEGRMFRVDEIDTECDTQP
ncbi:hypothetical protein AVEN_78383-1 [Araneus ventricosus]|uniref:Uncharacterized protein n=1 Tax=Araneus ventricosus TaxID=182803 RepID=A0A4Y2QY81_ARAVE|nr:hypothetical protein AVEN_23493-1 [Araneus ventricosus]GBN68350.1 hypothetical protein AVEN_34089-1 [Araneus ventricosus]GBN71605.1 hypothetical protein AVEN_160032-1 [Araneus ventricosus]GBN71855.1 hypothetical protein AVEN_78383-1 [Araneus ventricosus]